VGSIFLLQGPYRYLGVLQKEDAWVGGQAHHTIVDLFLNQILPTHSSEEPCFSASKVNCRQSLPYSNRWMGLQLGN
jgi:hypothetical protein